MHELYELKEMLVKELENYGKKGDLSSGSLEIVDKLAHATKNICKVIEDCEDGDYSGRGYYPMYYGNEGSYARGRGGNVRRDSRGRYASEGYSRSDFADRLREMMHEAPDEATKSEIQRLVSKVDRM